MKPLVYWLALLTALSPMALLPASVSAQDASVEEETSVDLLLTGEDVEDITDEELLEAEPSELPDAEEDDEFTEELYGEMLLDVEGNGEVYYVDPVDGGKEYLSDGAAAHRLLERRALGINEENFALLVQGEARDEASVCGENELGTRLRGRIVLRVEMQGEAWWVFPRNCRAYYVGTYEAAYELMKEFSLGITKENLAKVRDTRRQRLKASFRYSVYAYAQENGVTLEEAREAISSEREEVRACIREDIQVSLEENENRADVRARMRACVEASDLPQLNAEERQEIRQTIRENRRERIETNVESRSEFRADLRGIRVESRTRTETQTR